MLSSLLSSVELSSSPFFQDASSRSMLRALPPRSRRRRQRQWRHWLVLLVALLAFTLMTTPVVAASSSSSSNPYHTLGLSSSNTSQEEIQKQYRKLCLKYHPDKNVQKSPKERAHCEDQFKRVQQAYDQIGTPEARRNYQFAQRYGGSSSSSPYSQGGSTRSGSTSSRASGGGPPNNPFGSDPIAEALFRAFQQGRSFRQGGGPTFYFGTSPGGRPRFGVRRPFPSSSTDSSPLFGDGSGLSFKSIYVQKVILPLETLYTGVEEYTFELVDTWWNRWRAALRGRIAYLSFYQGLIYSLPILRVSKTLALIVGLVIAHATLPKPDSRHQSSKLDNRYYFTQAIRRGSKGASNNTDQAKQQAKNDHDEEENDNTNNSDGSSRIMFQSTQLGAPQVMFQLYEAPHAIYTRHDNDLHATIEITERQAKRGCTQELPHLDPSQEPIEVVVKPNFDEGQTILLTGRGWPVRNAPGVYLHGDLIVHVHVVPDKKKKKGRGRSNKNNKKKHSDKSKRQPQTQED